MELDDLDWLDQTKKPMSIVELIAAAKEKSVTPAAKKAFEEQCREREKQFLAETNKITNSWLNRQYTI